MGEEPGPEVEEKTLADPVVEEVVEEAEHSGDDGQADVRRRNPDEWPEVLWDQHLVHDDLEHPDHRGVDQRHEDDQDEADGQPLAVRPGVGPEPPEDVPNRHGGRGADQRLALRRCREERAEPSSQPSPPLLPELETLALVSETLAALLVPALPGCAGVASTILPRRRRRRLRFAI